MAYHTVGYSARYLDYYSVRYKLLCVSYFV